MRRDENGSIIFDEEEALQQEDIFADADATYGMSGAERAQYQAEKIRQQDVETVLVVMIGLYGSIVQAKLLAKLALLLPTKALL